jgi:hypothetical protein
MLTPTDAWFLSLLVVWAVVALRSESALALELIWLPAIPLAFITFPNLADWVRSSIGL